MGINEPFKPRSPDAEASTEPVTTQQRHRRNSMELLATRARETQRHGQQKTGERSEAPQPTHDCREHVARHKKLNAKVKASTVGGTKELRPNELPGTSAPSTL